MRHDVLRENWCLCPSDARMKVGPSSCTLCYCPKLSSIMTVHFADCRSPGMTCRAACITHLCASSLFASVAHARREFGRACMVEGRGVSACCIALNGVLASENHHRLFVHLVIAAARRAARRAQLSGILSRPQCCLISSSFARWSCISSRCHERTEKRSRNGRRYMQETKGEGGSSVCRPLPCFVAHAENR